MPHIDHFEIHAENIKISKSFYEELFGWAIEKDVKLDYWHINTGCDKAIVGGLEKRTPHLQGIVIYVSVSNIDDYVQKIERLGGKIVKQRTQVPSWGFYAICKDLSGNTFGLWEDNKELF